MFADYGFLMKTWIQDLIQPDPDLDQNLVLNPDPNKDPINQALDPNPEQSIGTCLQNRDSL
jgi:hypothetical protein